MSLSDLLKGSVAAVSARTSDLMAAPLAAVTGRSSDRLALHVTRLAEEAESAMAEAKSRRATYDAAAFAQEIGDKPKDSTALGNLRTAAEAAEARSSERATQLAMARAALSAALAEDAQVRRAEEFSGAHAKRRDRLKHGQALCTALAAVAEHWQALEKANAGLYASIPNVAEVVDLDGGMMRTTQLAGAIKVEIMRLGGDFLGEIQEPHKVEPMADKLARCDEYIRARLDEAAASST